MVCDQLQQAVLKNLKTNEEKIINVGGLFVAIGHIPIQNTIETKIDEIEKIILSMSDKIEEKEKKRIMKNLKIPVIPYNDIKEYVQLIQKINVIDGIVKSIEILQGVDNGWKPQKVKLKNEIDSNATKKENNNTDD